MDILKEMFNEDLIELKEKYTRSMLEATKEFGGLYPHITLFGREKIQEGHNKLCVVNIDIPLEMLEDDAGKELFIKKVIPEIAKEMKKRFKVYAISWVSEGWLRESKKNEPLPKDYKDLPITKEVIIFTYESEETFEYHTYDLVRNGKKVNEHGHLTDCIEITKSMEVQKNKCDEDVDGRFTDLLKHFLEK